MKPRDRVRMSLAHQKPDRCPMQISFTPEFAVRLRADLHQTAGPSITRTAAAIHTNSSARSAKTCCSHRSAGPTRITPTRPTPAGRTPTPTSGACCGERSLETRFGSGFYTEIAGHPLADARALDSYHPPDPHRRSCITKPNASSPPISATTGSSVLPLLRSSRPPGPCAAWSAC